MGDTWTTRHHATPQERQEWEEERRAVALAAEAVEGEPWTHHVLIARPIAVALLRAARRGLGACLAGLLLAGCGILEPPDGRVRFLNLTADRDILFAEVTPYAGGPVVVARTPIRPGRWADTPSLSEGCYDVLAAQGSRADGMASGGLVVRIVTHEGRAPSSCGSGTGWT